MKTGKRLLYIVMSLLSFWSFAAIFYTWGAKDYENMSLWLLTWISSFALAHIIQKELN